MLQAAQDPIQAMSQRFTAECNALALSSDRQLNHCALQPQLLDTDHDRGAAQAHLPLRCPGHPGGGGVAVSLLSRAEFQNLVQNICCQEHQGE